MASMFRRKRIFRSTRVVPISPELLHLSTQVKGWECPICYERGEKICIPFECGHGTCDVCLRNMADTVGTEEVNCPLCYASPLSAWVYNETVSHCRVGDVVVLGLREREQFFRDKKTAWDLHL